MESCIVGVEKGSLKNTSDSQADRHVLLAMFGAGGMADLGQLETQGKAVGPCNVGVEEDALVVQTLVIILESPAGKSNSFVLFPFQVIPDGPALKVCSTPSRIY